MRQRSLLFVLRLIAFSAVILAPFVSDERELYGSINQVFCSDAMRGLKIAEYKNMSREAKKMMKDSLQNTTFYKTAELFAKTYGDEFGKMVFQSMPQDQRTTIVIAMGGAEHLGTFLELYHRQFFPNLQVDFRYIDLSTALVKPWHAYSRTTDMTRVGIGPIPEGFKLNGRNDSDPEQLKEYLEQFQIYSDPNLFVVDTGMQGSIVEALGYIAKLENYSGNFRGFMLHRKAKFIESDLNIKSLYMRLFDSENFGVDHPWDGTARWAARFDHNNAQGAQLGVWDFDAFPRSIKSTVKFSEGKIQLSREFLLNTEASKNNYFATLLGFESYLRP